jgi:co-chaperonin GroES (HSP10)
MNTPLGNRIVLELVKAEEKKSAAGIILDTVQDKHVKAIVKAVSPDLEFSFLKEEVETLDLTQKHYPEQYAALKSQLEGRRPLVPGDTVLIPAGAGITTEEHGVIVPYDQIIMIIK